MENLTTMCNQCHDAIHGRSYAPTAKRYQTGEKGESAIYRFLKHIDENSADIDEGDIDAHPIWILVMGLLTVFLVVMIPLTAFTFIMFLPSSLTPWVTTFVLPTVVGAFVWYKLSDWMFNN
jgi:hypothetical protein